MDVSDRWEGFTEVFGKHPYHMCEIFCECMEQIVLDREKLLLDSDFSAYAAQRPDLFSKDIRDKGAGMDRCIGFIDGIVISVVRPNKHVRQLAV